MSEPVIACHLGRVEYERAWTLQKQLQAQLIDAKRKDPPLPLPHLLLLVEHPHVYTLGKSGDEDHLLYSQERLAARQARFIHVDRGGDITYHGPGQLIAYPLLDLDRFFTDIHRYLRTLEEVVIRTCAGYDLSGRRVEGRTGVWIGPDERGPERKICALGVRCSRWVTMHGLAFNLNTDLSYFDGIVPCGIRDRGVTSLAKELQRDVRPFAVREAFQKHFARCLDADLTLHEGKAAWDYLNAILEEPSSTVQDESTTQRAPS